MTHPTRLTATDVFYNTIGADRAAYATTPYLAQFGRFMARYAAAAQMAVVFEGEEKLGDDTAKGYEALIRLGMTYSAAEALQEAIKKHAVATEFSSSLGKYVVVSSPECAQMFRDDAAARLRAALSVHLHQGKPKELIEALAVSGDDVLPLTQGIRHLAFHGVLTPATVGYSRMGVKELLSSLYRETLIAIDHHFHTWVLEASAAEAS